MPLSYEDRQILDKSGFIEEEIDAFGDARAPDDTPQVINIQSGTWQDAIRSRLAWWNDKRNMGWPEVKIREALRRYYRQDEERSPWDFIKVEYRPPKRLTDYQDARQKRAKDTIEKGLRRYPK